MLQDELHRTAIEGDGVVEGALRPFIDATVVCLSFGRKSREHIIGVRVREIMAEKRMVVLRVTANSRKRRPTMSPMNSKGISTAINDTVSETMVKPICPAPCSAASSGECPSSM